MPAKEKSKCLQDEGSKEGAFCCMTEHLTRPCQKYAVAVAPQLEAILVASFAYSLFPPCPHLHPALYTLTLSPTSLQQHLNPEP